MCCFSFRRFHNNCGSREFVREYRILLFYRCDNVWRVFELFSIRLVVLTLRLSVIHYAFLVNDSRLWNGDHYCMVFVFACTMRSVQCALGTATPKSECTFYYSRRVSICEWIYVSVGIGIFIARYCAMFTIIACCLRGRQNWVYGMCLFCQFT